MADYKVISSDNHVFEPVDLWTSRAAPSLKDRMPHIERLEDGSYKESKITNVRFVPLVGEGK